MEKGAKLLTTNVNSFIDQDLRAIVHDSAKLHALFITYNEVYGYPLGLVETCNPNLTISVHSGGCRPPSPLDMAMLLVPDLRINVLACMTREQQVTDAFLTAKRHLGQARQHVGDQKKILVVLYVGLTAWQESADYARDIRAMLPEAMIVVLTCDCDLQDKLVTLQRLHDEGALNKAIVTPRCRGCGDMRDILEGLINTWGIRRPHA